MLGESLESGDVSPELKRLLFGRKFSTTPVVIAFLCAAFLASALSFVLLYAYARRVPFSWYTPAFIIATACVVGLAMIGVFLGIMHALDKRNKRTRFASGDVLPPTLYGRTRTSNVAMHVRALRRSECRKTSSLQYLLVFVATTTMVVAAGALGMIIGQCSVCSLESVLTEAISESVTGYVCRISSIAFLASCALLLLVGFLAEKRICNINLLFVQQRESDSPPPPYRDPQTSQSGSYDKEDFVSSVVSGRVMQDMRAVVCADWLSRELQRCHGKSGLSIEGVITVQNGASLG